MSVPAQKNGAGTVTVFSLSNGLRVVHCPNTTTQMVALNVMYNTGARDEDPGKTGLAHLFEHVMFGGSANVPDFDAVLTAAGGENNAFTGNDFTTYYSTAPAHNAETVFYVESDRMLSPLLSQATLDVQRNVVIEEFRQQYLNRPYGDVMHRLRSLLYPPGHPYSWPVIGKNIEQIRAITRDDLTGWFRRNYAPGNAVLAITGNITLERARQLAEKWFAPIPARPVPQRQVSIVTPPPEAQTVELRGNVPGSTVTAAYLMDPYGTRGYLAADAVTDLLSAGNAARMYRSLIVGGDGSLSDAEAMISGSEHQGMLMLTARMATEDADPRRALQLMVDQGRRIARDGVTDREMQRLRNRRFSMEAAEKMDYIAQGQRLAAAVMHGEEPDAMTARYNMLKADDLVECARAIFVDGHPAAVIYRPGQGRQNT